MELKYTLELPSKDKNFYPPTHPLSSGVVELRYPTAKDEDVMSDMTLIKKGTVVDEFIKGILVDQAVRDEYSKGNIFVFDKDAILMRSRMLAYGNIYSTAVECPNCGKKFKKYDIDLDKLSYKESKESSFEFELPVTKKMIKIKLLKVSDFQDIAESQKKMKELNIKGDGEITSLLKHVIESVDGDVNKNSISSFVDQMPSMDSRFIRGKLSDIAPGLNNTFTFECNDCGYEEENVAIPMELSFFWPKFG